MALKKSRSSKKASRDTRKAASRPVKARSRSAKPRRQRKPVEERHAESLTAVAAESLRTGILPPAPRVRPEEIPHEDLTMQVGDPDDSGLRNEYVGEDMPGASTPTPDQNDVDEIGRAYGVQEDDGPELHASSEILKKRDRRRSELKPPRRPQA